MGKEELLWSAHPPSVYNIITAHHSSVGIRVTKFYSSGPLRANLQVSSISCDC